jgi:hypothetical protein
MSNNIIPECLDIRRSDGLYCINDKNITKNNVIDNTYKVKFNSSTCLIESDKCTPDNPTFNCEATCVTKSNLLLNTEKIIWTGGWVSKPYVG